MSDAKQPAEQVKPEDTDNAQPEQSFDWTDPGAVYARLTEHGQFAGDDTPTDAAEAEPAKAASAEAETEDPSKDPSKDESKDEPADASLETAKDQAQDKSKDSDKDDDTPRGVQTKNKARVLPYHVLEDARAEASTYKQQVADLQSQVEALRNAESKSSESLEAADDELKEVLDRLNSDDEFPESEDVVKALNHAVKQANAANKRIAETEKRDAQRQQRQSELDDQAAADEARSEHEEALTTTPQLKKFWDAGGPLADQAKQISARMLEDTSYTPDSRAGHYKDVEREMCELLGIQSKPAAQADTPRAAAGPRKPLPAAQSGAPASLSDIPGGAAPEASEAEAFMEMGGMKGVAQLASMSPAQQDEFIRRNFGG